MHYINLKSNNKFYRFKKSIIQIRYAFTALFNISKIIFLFPSKIYKKISLKKIKVLIRALKNESSDNIIRNFKHYLNEGNTNEFENEINIFLPFEKEDYLNQKRTSLKKFLDTKAPIEFIDKSPIISVVLVFYNKAELSLACLKSLHKNNDIPIELIIIDNNSTDETQYLLDRIKGAKIIRNKKNLHFIKACNLASKYINCNHLLFLNNDTEIERNAISSALNTLKKHKNCGAVGGKIILPNGKLQEAGSIIWKDGSCLGYGRNKAHYLPEYNFMRVVDYCSAAFLLTKTELFKKHNGFDSLFEPAYYEETDYCLWLQEQGLEVIYDPKAVIRHFEFGSGFSENALKIQKENQKKFIIKHNDQLNRHLAPNSINTLTARHAASQHKKKRVLYIDDKIPHSDLGAGLPRSNTIIQCIHELGYQITIYPIIFTKEGSWDNAYRDINSDIELIRGFELNNFNNFIKERENYYDYIWVSRFHNLYATKSILHKYATKCKIIYDAEAIYTDRKFERLRMEGFTPSKNKIHAAHKKELLYSPIINTTVAVSEIDAKKFSKFGARKVKVLGHSIDKRDTKADFKIRRNLLFVGNLNDESSPNVDSILWFTREVFPLIESSIPTIKLNIVGSCSIESIISLGRENITIHGKIKDLEAIYDKNRVFIAPTRFAAGIPYKVHEAAANGIPIVATEILGKQLLWEHKNAILLSKPNPKDFAECIINLYKDEVLWKMVQENAYKKVMDELSLSSFKNAISDIIESA